MDVPLVVSVYRLWLVVGHGSSVDFLHRRPRHRVRRCEMPEVAHLAPLQFLLVGPPHPADQGNETTEKA